MTRPTVITLDSLDNRRQAFVAVLRGLTPARRLDYLDWCCAFARLTATNTPHLLAQAKADRKGMSALTRAATRRDDAANVMHANQIYMDCAHLAHNFGVEWLPMILELENWALGREPTPVRVAVAAWLSCSPASSPASPIRTSGRTDAAPSSPIR